MESTASKFKIVGSDEKGWDAVQITRNGPWWHSEQNGLWATYADCRNWVLQSWPDAAFI